MSKRFLVTGGAGFIGSAVVRALIGNTQHEVLVVDRLTYAGNLDSLAPVATSSRFHFVQKSTSSTDITTLKSTRLPENGLLLLEQVEPSSGVNLFKGLPHLERFFNSLCANCLALR